MKCSIVFGKISNHLRLNGFIIFLNLLFNLSNPTYASFSQHELETLGFESLESCGLRPLKTPRLFDGFKRQTLDRNSTGINRISNGIRAEYGQFPSFGALLVAGKPICGSTLVGPRLILTAAHCIETYLQNNRNNRNLRVSFGQFTDYSDYVNDKNVYLVNLTENVCTDSSYCSHYSNGHFIAAPNDLALIKLTKRVTYSDIIQPACLAIITQDRLNYLPRKGENYYEQPGLGYVDSARSKVKNLNYQIKEPYCDSQTEHHLNMVAPMQTCYSSSLDHNSRACMGDSGSGIYYYRTVLGVKRQFLAGLLSASGDICLPSKGNEYYTDIKKSARGILRLAQKLNSPLGSHDRNKCEFGLNDMRLSSYDCQGNLIML